jgi:hypothetical protein
VDKIKNLFIREVVSISKTNTLPHVVREGEEVGYLRRIYCGGGGVWSCGLRFFFFGSVPELSGCCALDAPLGGGTAAAAGGLFGAGRLCRGGWGWLLSEGPVVGLVAALPGGVMLRGPRVARSEGGALGGVAVSPGVVVLGCDGDGPVIAPLGLRGVRLGFSEPGEVLSLGVVVEGSPPDGPVIAPPELALPRDGRLGFSVLVELPFSPDGAEPAPLPLPGDAFDRSR